ncbi:MAG TPA: fructosamine kinase family protein [Solirubrobacteraceae bacterium]
MSAPGLAAEVGAALGRPVARLTPVAGGDLNDAHAAELAGGARVFVKAHVDPLEGTFAAEAAALAWLAEPGALPVPEVLAAGATWLALAWIDAGRLDAAGEEALGRGLAALHAAGAPVFGATAPGTPGEPPPPTRLGPLLLPNDPEPTWAAFYARRRLAPLTAMAERRGALPPGTARALHALGRRMDDLAGPPEPPARLHGDLWSGNVLADDRGRPHLIDPAAHGGHREADLAMLRLFGGPSERCFAAYAEVAPLADGHAERVGLWQLQPLLVHAVLFGGGYGAAVARTADRYA